MKGVDDILAMNGAEVVLDALDGAVEAPTRERESQTSILIGLVTELKLFHTPDGEGYAQVPLRYHTATTAIKSAAFKRWLTKQFFDAVGKPPGAQALSDAIALVDARAHHDGPELPIFVRVAGDDSVIYIDLGNEHGEVVAIARDGWRITVDPPVHFRRPKAQLALPRPVGGSSLELLRKFINAGNDKNWILMAAWLLAAARPLGPYPVLVLQGEQGSAKSTTARLLRRMIDPAKALVRTAPRSDRDLLISATNSWVMALDNLSGIPAWLSDALCRLSTGGGFSTRQLFTDSEEAIFDASRPVILNGIDQLAERPDLAERALILHLPAIPPHQRREEGELMREFDEALPVILGALYDAISGALRRRPEVKLDEKPRMADFAVWVSAGEQGMGFPPGTFLRAYAMNRSEAVLETIEADVVGASLVGYMNQRAEKGQDETWCGSCTELLQTLHENVSEETRRSKDWPSSSRSLSSKLRRLATFLREVGLAVEFAPRTGGQRPVRITRRDVQNTVTTVTTVTADMHPSENQSDRGSRHRDGCDGGATVAPSLVMQPSLPPGEAISPRTNHLEAEGDGRDGCDGVLQVCFGSHQIDHCAQCGPNEWGWSGEAWTCDKCGRPFEGRG